MRWPLTRLGDLCEVISGATPKTGIDHYWGGEILWATPKDISKLNSPFLVDTPDKITMEGFRSCSTKLIPFGAVLVSSRAPIGLVAIAGAEMCTNQGFKSLVPGPTLHSGYLYHCMRAYSARLAALGNGATFKEVSKSIVEDFEIPLPPLEEQQRIAAILDKADSLRRKRQEAIRLTDDFLRAVFLDIFGDPAANGKGLPVRQLGDVCRFYAGNSLPPGERFDGQPDGVLHIKVGDMNLPGNESDIHVAREWSRTGSGGIIAPEGAILIPKRGGAIATNKKRVLLRPCALDPNLMAIGPGVELRQEVLLEWFKQFDLTSISSGSAVPQLNKGDLAPLKITVPPLALQDKFVQVARKVKSAMAKQSEQLSSIHAVCAALTANLLSA